MSAEPPSAPSTVPSADVLKHLHAPQRPRAPKLPRAHLNLHSPFRTACEQFEPRLRDYNEEFQMLWTEECEMTRRSSTRRRLGELLTSFDEVALRLTKIVTSGAEAMSRNGVQPVLGFSQCYRQGNLFIREWDDSQLAQNLQSCFKAVFTAKCPHLHIPLISTHSHCGRVVSVQSLIPLTRDSKKLYRGDGVPDMPCARPVHHYARRLLEALNIDAGDDARQLKQPGLEIVEALDGRWYAIAVYGLLPPLFPDAERSPKKRIEHVMASSDVVRYDAGITPQFEGMIQVFCDFVPRFVGGAQLNDATKDIQRQKKLVELLHYCTLNIAMMGTVLVAVMQAEDDDRETSQAVQTMIAIEMIARGAKAAMFAEMREAGAAGDSATARRFLERTLGALLMNDVHGHRSSFRAVLVPFLAHKFSFSVSNKAVVQLLSNTAYHERVKIVKRICNLCGFVLSKGVVEEVKVVPSNRNLSVALASMTQAESTRAMVSSERDAFLTEEFLVSFALPQRAALLASAGQFPAAISLARQVMSARCNFNKKSYLYFDAMVDTATLLEASGNLEDAETMLNCAMDALCRTPLLAEDSETALLLRGDVPTFVPGRIDLRCRLGHLFVKQGRLKDARLCFLDALDMVRRMAPSVAQHSAHLMLAPFKGLLAIAETQLAGKPGGVSGLSGGGTDEVVSYVELHQQLVVAAMCLRPTAAVFEVLERLGTLLLRCEMYAEAAECLRDACEVSRACYGGLSRELAQALNAVAFVYYKWNVLDYGDLCEELMRESVAITGQVSGEHSMDHLVALNNLGNLLIARRRWAAASKVFGTALAAPAVAAIAQEKNPVIRSMERSMNTIRMRFRAIAVIRMQQFWKRHKRRKAAALEFAPEILLLQRVGRGYLGRAHRNAPPLPLQRRMTSFFSAQAARGSGGSGGGGTASSSTPNTDHSTPARCISAMLLRASLNADPSCRNWNEDFQALCEQRFTKFRDAGERGAALQQLVSDFEDAAQHAVEAVSRLVAGTNSLNDSTCAAYVAGETNAYRVGNLAVTNGFTRQMQLIQLRGYQDVFAAAIPFLCVPLATTVEHDGVHYFVSSLIPRGRDIVLAYRDDAAMDGIVSEIAQFLVRWALRAQGVAPTKVFGGGRYWKQVGVEVVEGGDARLYLTNSAGLNPAKWTAPESHITLRAASRTTAAAPTLAGAAREAPRDPAASVGAAAGSVVQRALSAAGAGDFDGASAELEHAAVALGKEHGRRSLEVTFLLFVHFAVCEESGRRAEALRHLRQLNDVLWNLQRDSFPAIFARVQLAELLLKHIGPAQAFAAFAEAARVVREMAAPTPLHCAPLRVPIFCGLLECERAGFTDVNLVEVAAGVMGVARGAWPSQATMRLLNELAAILFARCEFRSAALTYREAARVVRALHGSRSIEYARALSNEGAVYFKWNAAAHADHCTTLLTQAVDVLQEAAPNSVLLGTTHINLGCLLVQLADHAKARAAFEAATKILQAHLAHNDPELVRLRKQKKLLHGRVRLNAIIRLQFFVRRWRRRRRLTDPRTSCVVKVPADFIINERALRRRIFDEACHAAWALWWRSHEEAIRSVEREDRILIVQNELLHADTIFRHHGALIHRLHRRAQEAARAAVDAAETEARVVLERLWALWAEVEGMETVTRVGVCAHEAAARAHLPFTAVAVAEAAARKRLNARRVAGLERMYLEHQHGASAWALLVAYSPALRFGSTLVAAEEESARRALGAEARRTKGALGAWFAEAGNAIAARGATERAGSAAESQRDPKGSRSGNCSNSSGEALRVATPQVAGISSRRTHISSSDGSASSTTVSNSIPAWAEKSPCDLHRLDEVRRAEQRERLHIVVASLAATRAVLLPEWERWSRAVIVAEEAAAATSLHRAGFAPPDLEAASSWESTGSAEPEREDGLGADVDIAASDEDWDGDVLSSMTADDPLGSDSEPGAPPLPRPLLGLPQPLLDSAAHDPEDPELARDSSATGTETAQYVSVGGKAPSGEEGGLASLASLLEARGSAHHHVALSGTITSAPSDDESMLRAHAQFGARLGLEASAASSAARLFLEFSCERGAIAAPPSPPPPAATPPTTTEARTPRSARAALQRPRAVATVTRHLLESREADRRNEIAREERSALAAVVSAIRRHVQGTVDAHYEQHNEKEQRRQRLMQLTADLLAAEGATRKGIADDAAFEFGLAIRGHRRLIQAFQKEQQATGRARSQDRRRRRRRRPGPPVEAPRSASSRLAERSPPRVVDGSALLPRIDGFAADALMLAALRDEAQLRALRAALAERRAALSAQLEDSAKMHALLMDGSADDSLVASAAQVAELPWPEQTERLTPVRPSRAQPASTTWRAGRERSAAAAASSSAVSSSSARGAATELGKSHRRGHFAAYTRPRPPPNAALANRPQMKR